ncbi:hypothetical protein [Candidatus Villigracilis affinis]|nr:hypothetical protein [Anaerolineales bacterium]
MEIAHEGLGAAKTLDLSLNATETHARKQRSTLLVPVTGGTTPASPAAIG